MRGLLKSWRGRRLRRILREEAPADTCYISSNCIGGRLSDLGGHPYLSPTVGLWFGPDDFLRFVADLPRHLRAPMRERPDLADACGHPVGELEDVVVWLQHHPDFATARRDWERRRERVDPDRVVVTFTDRDGATTEHLRRFEQLPFRKIAFTAGGGGPRAVRVPAYREAVCVGDLYSDWIALAPVLTRSRCRELFRAPA